MAAQDPLEPFDLCDADGRPLGLTKARALVHRDGDWHRSLHLWVILPAESPPGRPAPSVLFQRRSAAKDTWPGALDIAVTGHLRAGETVAGALREAEEEIGLPVSLDQIVRLGVRFRVHEAGAIRDREVQEIYATIADRPLAAFVPGAEEVDALLAIALNDAIALFEGAVPSVTALALTPGAGVVRERPGPTLAEFIPAGDGYPLRALESIRGWLEGGAPTPWTIR